MKKRAFTLIELLLVVVVVVTLALIALPNYSKSKQKATQKEGLSNIKLIAAAERIYRMENTDYITCNCSSAANCANATGCNTQLSLMLNTANWTYGVSTSGSVGSKTATITAKGSCTYTLKSADFDSKDFSTSSGCI